MWKVYTYRCSRCGQCTDEWTQDAPQAALQVTCKDPAEAHLTPDQRSQCGVLRCPSGGSFICPKATDQ